METAIRAGRGMPLLPMYLCWPCTRIVRPLVVVIRRSCVRSRPRQPPPRRRSRCTRHALSTLHHPLTGFCMIEPVSAQCPSCKSPISLELHCRAPPWSPSRASRVCWRRVCPPTFVHNPYDGAPRMPGLPFYHSLLSCSHTLSAGLWLSLCHNAPFYLCSLVSLNSPRFDPRSRPRRQ